MTTLKVQDLLEAGSHFGHQTKKWNPRMKKYVYGVKNGIYIIDLTKTMKQIYDACNFLQQIVSEGGTILFVGTKRQAQGIIKEAAERTGMFYVCERWLGGTLTNNRTIQKSIMKMKEIDEILASPEKSATMKKKELVNLQRNVQKMHKNLDGIAGMRKLPSALFVVDVCTEEIAIKEAAKLKIPVVAIVDTNGTDENISYPIVANDDAVKSIKVITDVIVEAVKDATEIYRRHAEEQKATDKENDEKTPDEESKEKAVRKRKPTAREGRPSRGKPAPRRKTKSENNSAKKASSEKSDGAVNKAEQETQSDKKGE